MMSSSFFFFYAIINFKNKQVNNDCRLIVTNSEKRKIDRLDETIKTYFVAIYDIKTKIRHVDEKIETQLTNVQYFVYERNVTSDNIMDGSISKSMLSR